MDVGGLSTGQLIAVLAYDDEDALRQLAADELVARHDKRAVVTLLAMIDRVPVADFDRYRRRFAAANTLVRMGADAALLAYLLKSGDADVIAQCVRALAQNPPCSALLDALGTADEVGRFAAARMLLNLGCDDIAARIEGLLQTERDRRTRLHMVLALGKDRTQAAYDLILKLIMQGDAQTSADAGTALVSQMAHRGPDVALHRHASWRVRFAALNASGALSSFSRAALFDRSGQVRRFAWQNLWRALIEFLWDVWGHTVERVFYHGYMAYRRFRKRTGQGRDAR